MRNKKVGLCLQGIGAALAISGCAGSDVREGTPTPVSGAVPVMSCAALASQTYPGLAVSSASASPA